MRHGGAGEGARERQVKGVPSTSEGAPDGAPPRPPGGHTPRGTYEPRRAPQPAAGARVGAERCTSWGARARPLRTNARRRRGRPTLHAQPSRIEKQTDPRGHGGALRKAGNGVPPPFQPAWPACSARRRIRRAPSGRTRGDESIGVPCSERGGGQPLPPAACKSCSRAMFLNHECCFRGFTAKSMSRLDWCASARPWGGRTALGRREKHGQRGLSDAIAHPYRCRPGL